MSICADQLVIFRDAGLTIEHAIVAAEAMQRGDDFREASSIIEALRATDATAEQIAAVVMAWATETIARNARTVAAQGSAVWGAKARWGYEGPETPRLPEKEWWPLRAAVLRRDEHTCEYCGAQDERMCVDHVVPLSRGGTNEPDNLVACCIPCNSSKCDKLLDEWPGRYQ